jgi:hypothetical protein
VARKKTAEAEVEPTREEPKKMGSFISDDLDDVEEAKVAPEGEYDLRIVRALDKPSKKGEKMCTVSIKIEEPGIDAPLINVYLMGWDADTPPEQVRMRKLEIKRFCACFNVPTDFETDDLVGETGRCFVYQEESKADGNVYNRLRLPKLKD